MARKTSDSRISTKRRTWVAARRRTKKETRWLRDRWFQFFFTTLCRERCSWNFNGSSATTFSSDSSRRIRIGQDHVRLLQIRVAMHAIRIRSGDSFSSGSLYVRGIRLRRKPSLCCFAKISCLLVVYVSPHRKWVSWRYVECVVDWSDVRHRIKRNCKEKKRSLSSAWISKFECWSTP